MTAPYIIEARLKILSKPFNGLGGWHDICLLSLMLLRGLDAQTLRRAKIRRRAYLARYLHQPINTWDNFTTREIRAYLEETIRIISAENGQKPDKSDDDDIPL